MKPVELASLLPTRCKEGRARALQLYQLARLRIQESTFDERNRFAALEAPRVLIVLRVCKRNLQYGNIAQFLRPCTQVGGAAALNFEPHRRKAFDSGAAIAQRVPCRKHERQ